MPSVSKQKRIDELIDKADVSLSRSANFECERMGVKALSMAHQQSDYKRMIRITEILRESRVQRLDTALACNTVTIFNGAMTENIKVEPGCYLIQPPQVGADARRLRLAAFQNDIHVAVLCREPITNIKRCPIVAIYPGTTLRTKVKPPKKLDKPDIKWFADAMEALGDAAIECIDPGADVSRRINTVIEFLDALPEHARLHETLIELCREAMDKAARKAEDEQSSSESSGRGRKRRLPSQ